MNRKICLLFSIALFSANILSGASFKPANLTAYDAITVPGRSVILTAEIDKKGLLFAADLKGEKIYFSIDGSAAGESRSNDEGVATLNYAFAKPGEYELEVKISTASAYRAEPAAAKIFCSDRRRPAIVVDIDHTVADVSWETYIFKSNKDVKPLKDAPEVMRKLSAEYDILFVTKRDEMFLKKTEEWLRMYRFPDAPVFFWDLGSYPLGAAKYKTGRICELQNTWSNILIGIGDQKTDIEAYRANCLEYVIIIGKRGAGRPGVTYVSGWNEIGKMLLGKTKIGGIGGR